MVPLSNLNIINKTVTLDEALVTVQTDYLKDLDNFESELELFYKVVFKEGQSKENIKKAFKNLKHSYKRTELFLEYFDPTFVKMKLNGAPLPKLEPNVPENVVLNPNGLQTLDELIYSDELDLKEIQKISKDLKNALKSGLKFMRSKNFEHRYVFEACKLNIVRSYTLGLTGFDTPSSLMGLDDVIVGLGKMKEVLIPYVNDANSIVLMIDNYSQYLKDNNSFDKLDRLHVLTEFVNPLIKNLVSIQNKLQIEFYDEGSIYNSAINYKATNLFESGFLRPSYYSEIQSEELVDKNRIELGKKLFNDTNLSKSGKLSCASCHNPKNAFTDLEAKSLGSKGKLDRNAPTLLYSVYASHYFHDMREYNLERQLKHVVMDDNEFDSDYIEIIDKLSSQKEYQDKFNEIYPQYNISVGSITNALTTYVASLGQFDSVFDKYVKGEVKEVSSQVRNGYNLFMGKAACGTCHFAPTFSGLVPPYYQESESEVLGIPEIFDTLSTIFVDPDLGRAGNARHRDALPHFIFSFKTPTIRNIELTGPYMHNGSMTSLEDVMAFYNKGGGIGFGIDLDHQTLSSDPLELSESEINDIIAFMQSLNDGRYTSAY